MLETFLFPNMDSSHCVAILALKNLDSSNQLVHGATGEVMEFVDVSAQGG